ncbi:MAG: hypothetical protein H5T98_06265 [Syntrophomonadaceae bacterium]|nr:hypothetical protein [Syntrophomonadaceae bacterium]
MTEMKAAKIAREDKNMMRSRLEKVLAIQTDLGEKMETYQRGTRIEEYCRFWDEIKKDNEEIKQKILKYMVLKCNR